MEDLFEQKQARKNIYVIRRRLAELKMCSNASAYILPVGKFYLKIITYNDGQRWLPSQRSQDNILRHQTVDVYPFEIIREQETYINLATDTRFKDYQPIVYETVQGVNVSGGKKMPISYLCELIQYMYRLSDITVFL